MSSSASTRRFPRQKLAVGLLAAQMLTACVAWIIAWHNLESIVATGPILTVIGLALAIVVRPSGSWLLLAVGLSAPVVCAVGAFTISVFRLGPEQARQPILAIVAVYLFAIAPAVTVAITQLRNWPIHANVGRGPAWHYSMRSLLIVMTVVAMLTVAGTAVARSLPNFPIVFASYGFVVIGLVGFIARRFYIRHQRLLHPTNDVRPSTLDEWLDARLFASFLSRKPVVRCSFCGRSHDEAGPFAEGRDGSLICGECVEACTRLIAATQANSSEREEGREANKPPAAL